MKPTPEQELAATFPRSVAVTAGAGTGKTRMLAERYLHHVVDDKMSPLEIVAVTFTDKAAAELRSRIRETLAQRLSDENAIAEVEAAQISTIHALAARICRDFYDLAGIPADFAVLDERDAPLWKAEKFDEAMSLIDEVTLEYLGFEWTMKAVNELLDDPFCSEKALSLGSSRWEAVIEEAKAKAIADLRDSEEWAEAECLRDCCGDPSDRLEGHRAALLAALHSFKEGSGDINNIAAAMEGFRKNLGSKKSWADGDIDRVRECLAAFRDKLRTAVEIARLQLGPDDEEAAARLPLLNEVFHTVYEHISREKLREKVLDFNDLERYALKVLEHQQALDHYLLRWRAFLIDEFQDTNPTQAEILRRLTAGAIVTVVGDEKQSIYGFRGADMTVFRDVRTHIQTERNGTSVNLDKTFRSHEALARSMNAVFAPVLGPMHQSLESKRERGPKTASPYITAAYIGEEKEATKQQRQVQEGQYIADQIEELHRGGIAYRDMAIIGRKWGPLSVYLDVMLARGIPAVDAGGGNLLATREAQDVYALLKFLAEPDDNIPLVALLRSPFFAYSDIVLYEAAAAVRNGTSWWAAVRSDKGFAQAVKVLDELFAASQIYSAEQVVRIADKLTGYSAVISNMPQASRRIADLNGVYDLLRSMESRGRGDVFGTARYLRELYETETDIPRPPLDPGEAVVLMTIHKAKGLEWPVVFVPGLSLGTGGFGTTLKIDSNIGVTFKLETDTFDKAEPAIYTIIKERQRAKEAEEAKRLLYVAVTRAEDKVILSSPEGKGGDWDTLQPGLDAAGVLPIELPFDAAKAIPPIPAAPGVKTLPPQINAAPFPIGLTAIPVTGLSDYYRCPLQFRYRYVDGHTGVSTGSTAARNIGSLTHKALELGITDAADLRKVAPESRDDEINEAVKLAARFRGADAFSAVRSGGIEAEVPLTLEKGGLKLAGIADLVGDDFVLDYKTDSTVEPDEHRFQVWAYTEALEKPVGYLAYLRHDRLHSFDSRSLEGTRAEAENLIRGITQADYHPRPSVQTCGRCPYNSICDAAVTEEEPAPFRTTLFDM